MSLNDAPESQPTQDLSFLQEANGNSSAAFIADVKAKLAVMRNLERKVIETQAAFEKAKQDLEDYKAKVVVASMVTAGLNSLQDDEGNTVRIESKYYCNPNKDKGREEIEAWVKKMGGEHLLKHFGKVAGDQLPILKEAGIPFADVADINTNSLKSFILDLLGEKKNSVKRISLADIPEPIHFTVQQDVIVE